MVHQVPQRMQIAPTAYRLRPAGTDDPTRRVSPLAATLLAQLHRLPHRTLDHVTPSEVLRAQHLLCQQHGHATSRLVRAAFAELLRQGDVLAVDGSHASPERTVRGEVGP